MKFILDEKNRKNFLKIGFEILFLTIKERKLPRYYFRYYYHLSKNNLKDMYSRDDILKLYNSGLFDFKDKEVLDDKISFYLWCTKNKISTPYTFQVENNNQLKLELEERSELFLKPNFSMQGKGCHILKKSQFLEHINYEGWIAQEKVLQHPIASKFNESSLNTMRVHTFKKETGEIRVFSSYFRFGSQGSDVDNVSSGGYYVPFDFNRWNLGENAYSSFDFQKNSIQFIPGTQTSLSSLILPFELESKELIVFASKAIENKIVGWDLAFGENGPIIIEGNAVPDLNFAQNASSGLKNIDYVRECFETFL